MIGIKNMIKLKEHKYNKLCPRSSFYSSSDSPLPVLN